MKTYLLNPPASNDVKYIREGRCMQSKSSWATIWPPISLGILANIARKKGEVRLIDCNVEDMTLNDVLKDIEEFNPDVAIVNTAFPSIEFDMEAVAAIKGLNPKIKTVAFGVYFTLLEAEGVEPYDSLDFACYYEPDETTNELLDAIQNKTDLRQIKGLIYRENGQIVTNEQRPMINDMDSLPVPARDLFRNERYLLPHNGKRFTLINVARGCPYPCTYCIANVYYGKPLRKHSVTYLMNEIRECVEKYDIDHFLFWEEVFTLDKKFAFEMCDAIIESGLNISWATTTRADLLEKSLLEKMKEANCEMLGLGIESSSQEILDNVKKKCKIADIERGVKLCKEAGIRTMGHFIYGLPGETAETASQTMEFAKKLDLDFIQTYSAIPYPKTELGELAKKKNWIKSYRWSDYDLTKSIMATDSLTSDEVNQLRDKSLRSFYFRPSVVFKQLKVITSFRHFLKSLDFLEWIYVKRRQKK